MDSCLWLAPAKPKATRDLLPLPFSPEWIATRLAVGGSTYVSSLIHRLLRDTKERRTLAAHERTLGAESEKEEK